MKATVYNYISENNVDFYVEVNLTGNRTVEFFIQPEVRNNTVTDITTIDSRDDVLVINPDLFDDMIEKMQEALDEYIGVKRYVVTWEYRNLWNSERDINDDSQWSVTSDEIERLAVEWGTPVERLMEQVDAVEEG